MITRAEKSIDRDIGRRSMRKKTDLLIMRAARRRRPALVYFINMLYILVLELHANVNGTSFGGSGRAIAKFDHDPISNPDPLCSCKLKPMIMM